MNWQAIEDELDARAGSLLPGLLSAEACLLTARLHGQESGFRSCVVMERHGFGRGEYKYFDYPLPDPVAVLLSAPGRDFEGGEFVLTEQRPRMQSRVEVVPLRQGAGVVFAVNHRPVNGTRGAYRVATRHGVSRLRSGRRHTLGLILHDAA